MDFLLYSDLNYWLLILPILALSGYVQYQLKSKFKKFSRQTLSINLSGKESAVAATIVLMAFTGAFGVLRQMGTVQLLIDEMDDKTSKTNYGKEVKAIPLGVLKFIFAGVFVIIAIFQLLALY